MLAGDHGVIWRRDVAGILKAYNSWASGETRPKAVIIYDTMWESTAGMAVAVARGLSGDGISVKLFDLRFNNASDIMTDVLDARAVLLGSSLLNSGLLPRMAAMVAYMSGLRPANKIGAAFGSYGWSDMSVKLLKEAMEGMKFTIVDDGVSAQYVPTEDALKRCVAMGEKIRKAILER